DCRPAVFDHPDGAAGCTAGLCRGAPLHAPSGDHACVWTGATERPATGWPHHVGACIPALYRRGPCKAADDAARTGGTARMTSVLLKFAHIIAIAGWSAGLICLPFLYVQRRRLSGDALHRLHNFTRFFYVALVSPAAFVAV